MANSYICNTAKNTVGRTTVNLNAQKCPPLQRGDLVYLADLNYVINSRWVVAGVNDRIIKIVKKPETSISVPQEEIISKKYVGKYSKLNDSDAEILNRHFNHQIKIFPSYDYASKNNETNKTLNLIKKIDPKIEVYVDAIPDPSATANNRLQEPYSVVIINSFGTIAFKCLNNNPESGDYATKVRFANQVKCNDIDYLLSSSPQLVDEREKLKIKHINAIIYETDNQEFIDSTNDTLTKSGSNTRLFTSESFIKFIKEVYHRASVINEIERIGIVQSLLPKYINSKTFDISSEPLDFTPNDTFELDDIQKDTLRQLNQRTYIKASAGSGKTILLLAKAYEIAAANPNKEFLLLCFNSKLAEDIQNQATNTGRNAKNLRISTLDKYLKDENIPFAAYGADNEFEARKKSFVELVSSGKLSYSYGGIFVDEVQQMRDEWLAALLKCTDNHKYMIVSGDYHQSINPSLVNNDDADDDFIEEGDASDYVIGGYKFETIILDKNYRNTKPIAKVLTKMVSRMNKEAEALGLQNDSKNQKQILGRAYKESNICPRCIKTNSDTDEVRQVCKQVDNLVDIYDCAPSDILIICPKQTKLISEIERHLRRKYDVCNFTGYMRSNARIASSGIKIGTIGKSIGLDFKAVILFKTDALKNFLDNADSNIINSVTAMKQQNKSTKKKYLSALRNIYVACSRAREVLIVLDDSKTDNLLVKFIRDSGMEAVGYE